MTRAKASTRNKVKRPDDTFEVSTLEQLRVLSDPLRMRILNCLFGQPKTVKQVADELDMTATRLYYHVGELERIGIIQLIETRIKSGIVEKYYRTVADNVRVPRNLLQLAKQEMGSTSYGELLASIMEATADDLRLAAASGTLTPPDDATARKLVIVSRNMQRLNRDQANRFVAKLTKLANEINNAEDKDGELLFGFAIAFFPMKPADDQDSAD